MHGSIDTSQFYLPAQVFKIHRYVVTEPLSVVPGRHKERLGGDWREVIVGEGDFLPLSHSGVDIAVFHFHILVSSLHVILRGGG